MVIFIINTNMTKKGKIYKIKNIVNQKEYVGCTISTIKKRFEEHAWRCLNSDSNTKFCNSIRKNLFRRARLLIGFWKEQRGGGRRMKR